MMVDPERPPTCARWIATVLTVADADRIAPTHHFHPLRHHLPRHHRHRLPRHHLRRHHHRLACAIISASLRLMVSVMMVGSAPSHHSARWAQTASTAALEETIALRRPRRCPPRRHHARAQTLAPPLSVEPVTTAAQAPLLAVVRSAPIAWIAAVAVTAVPLPHFHRRRRRRRCRQL